MQFILITPPYIHSLEIEILQAAMNKGVDRIHVRKHIEQNELRAYLNQLNTDILANASLHYEEDLMMEFPINGFHLSSQQRQGLSGKELDTLSKQYVQLSTSFHSKEDALEYGNYFDYAFCSPVFSSISKKGHHPKEDWDVSDIDVDCSLIALGGISAENVSSCQEKGFDGVAILGNIWQVNDLETAISNIQKIKAACDLT